MCGFYRIPAVIENAIVVAEASRLSFSSFDVFWKFFRCRYYRSCANGRHTSHPWASPFLRVHALTAYRPSMGIAVPEHPCAHGIPPIHGHRRSYASLRPRHTSHPWASPFLRIPASTAYLPSMGIKKPSIAGLFTKRF